MVDDSKDPLDDFEIGYPFVCIPISNPESEGVEAPPRKPIAYPIGYPAPLMMLSYVMWSMQWVGLVLKAMGNRWAIFARRAYWKELIGYELSPPPPPRKPPDPTVRLQIKTRRNGKVRMMHLALQVALRMANDVPDIAVSSQTMLRKQLRRRLTGGRLNVTKLTDVEKSQVLRAVENFPDQLLHAGQVLTLVVDTGASRSVTGYKEDFVPGTLKPLKSQMHFEGIAGNLSATHQGLSRLETFDDDGKLTIVEHTALYVPGLKCRLFSPQSYLQELHFKGGGGKKTGVENGVTRMMKVFWDRTILPTADGKGTITFPHDKVTRLPRLSCFKNALAASKTLALASVTDESNQNLTRLQKTLLQWHFRLGHMGFQWLQWIGRQGILGHIGEQIGKTSVCPPKCASCQYGKQERNPKPGATQKRDQRGILKKDKLEPGDLIFSDQYESRVQGRVFNARGSAVHSQKIVGGTLFCDAASGRISVHNQVSLAASDTIASKLKFERDAGSAGVAVKHYCTDNGTYTATDFLEELDKKDQTIRLSGVGAHHQNGVAENAIKNVVRTARTMMIHAALRWPEQADKKLWPMALQHAVFLHNHTPRQDTQLSPEELWCKTKSDYHFLQHAHPWGCPVYVLDPKIQDGHKLPKWRPQSRRAQYMGYSPLHASTVGLVRNLVTGNVSPQFHLVYDDWFETVHSTEQSEPDIWPELVQKSVFSNDFDDGQYMPELDKQWMDDEELKQRERTSGPRPGQRDPQPPREPAQQREQEAPIPEADSTEEPPERDVGPAAPGDDAEVPTLRRSTRHRRLPDRFTPDTAHGYIAKTKEEQFESRSLRGHTKKSQYSVRTISRWKGLMLATAVRLTRQAYDYNYLYALLMDQEYGVMQDMVPDVLERCPTLMKAQSNDPDLPPLHVALAGPHREEFLAAMRDEISELEKHGTWTVVKRRKLPEGANVLPSTWALRIKRYPDGRVRKFKARFCARGDKQVEGVDYFEKYAPVVSWSTVRMLLVMSIDLGWETRQVDFSNAFVQAELNEEVYIKMPQHFVDSTGDTTDDAVLKLNKSLYGLVQAPMYWYNHLAGVLDKKGFKPSDHDPCMFYGRGFIVLVYVDDCLFFGPDGNKIDAFISELKDKDKMALTIEDDAFHFLGVEVKTAADGMVELLQVGLIEKVLKTMGMENCHVKDTPASSIPLGTDADGAPFTEEWQYSSVVGMLLYLSSNSRPDIQFAVHQCARFTHSPKASHAEAVKRIARYLKGTRDRGLTFRPDTNVKLDCYVDADFAGLWGHEDDQDPVCVKSRTGFVFTIAGCPVHWSSKLQTEIALSTLEAEYIALSSAMREMLPMRRLFREIGVKMKLGLQDKGLLHSTVFEDNNGALGLALAPRLTPRTKHIAVKYHFFKSHIGDEDDSGIEKGIFIRKIASEEQKADIFTKGLPFDTFKVIRGLLMGW